MAAEALLSIAQNMIGEILKEQFWLFACATNELKKVQGMLQSIRALLADAERRVVEEDSVRLWLSRLRGVAYDIEDVVGDWLLEKDGNEDVGGDNDDRRNKLCECLSILSHLFSQYVVSRYKLGVNIKEITERLDQISKEKNQFNLSQMCNPNGERRPSLRSRTTTSYMNEGMIGRDDDIKNVISKLISESSSSVKEAQQVQVIAIVGIGGQGKTTLARNIYHHPQVQNHFQGNLYWVFVSNNFDLERLIKAIMEGVTRKATSLSELNVLQDELMEALRGKRFLLVLDDVWNADERWWKTLQPCLESGASGSRILVTTRPEKVAKNTLKATYIHQLEGLSPDNSWSLFKTIALEGRSEAKCLELEIVGREIVKKCNGVPLCITVMATVMNSMSSKNDWENILNSKMWSLLDDENNILPALWLSYENLPSHLRQCFVYCSIFPKSSVLKKEQLVKLWVAQGFIRPVGNRDMEDIAAGYFDDLVAWSIFQQVEVDYQGFTICKIHDLLHDLAEFIARDEIYTDGRTQQKLKQGLSLPSCDARHAFLSFESNDDNPSLPSHIAKKLRTLFFNRVVKEIDIINVLHEAKFLRAVILCHSKIERLPDDIGKLKHLRYMDLSNTPIEELPESVSCLPNLHTLNLNSCRELKQLPRGIGRMVSLKYLEIRGTDSLQSLPKGLGNINGLRRLCKFIVGGEGGCKIEELQQLSSLQGCLEIEHVERVSSREEAVKAELRDKSHLRKLVLRMSGRNDDDEESRRVCSVFEGLQPPKNVKELEVYGYRGWNLPGWMQGMSCLRVLILSDCEELKSLPDGLTLIQSLEKFEISYCRNLESLPEGFGKLEKLRKLEISKCEKLTGLPNSLWQLQMLKYLKIQNCSALLSLPDSMVQLKALKSLNIERCEKLTCLPNSLGQLQKLEDLEIWECSALLSLPDSMVQLKALKSLNIKGCEKLTCLSNSLGQLQKLQQLNINECSSLLSVPDSMVQLKALKSLDISGCEKLTCLPNSLGQLQMLEYLGIQNCSALLSLPDSMVQLKALKSLNIKGCEKLTCLPNSLGQLQKLQQLNINKCSSLLSLPDSMVQLKALKSLNIEGCEKLTCLPNSLGQLQKLEDLKIRECSALLSLPNSMVQLKALKSLHISGCEKLTCLPNSLGQLQKLEDLEIWDCSALLSLPDSMVQLKALKSLNIEGCEKLTCLPNSLGQLQKLQQLNINKCSSLLSLPDSMVQLKALKSLNIEGCEKLTCLPNSLGQLQMLETLKIWNCSSLLSLPDSMVQLKALNYLEILFCPLLFERCKRGGEDWPKISHIPGIRIHDEWIQQRHNESIESDGCSIM